MPLAHSRLQQALQGLAPPSRSFMSNTLGLATLRLPPLCGRQTRVGIEEIPVLALIRNYDQENCLFNVGRQGVRQDRYPKGVGTRRSQDRESRIPADCPRRCGARRAARACCIMLPGLRQQRGQDSRRADLMAAVHLLKSNRKASGDDGWANLSRSDPSFFGSSKSHPSSAGRAADS